MRTRSAEVLIVGAGAAGCALANLLAHAGCNVLLLERACTSGKDKPCGGVITGTGQQLMDKIYGEGVLRTLRAARIDKMRVLYRSHETSLSMEFCALPRARLDSFLLEQAVRVGVRIAERTVLVDIDEAAHVATCKNLESGAAFRVEYGILVAADGANSTTRLAVAGARPHTVVSLVAEAAPPADGSTLVQRVFPGVAGGCWLIPQGDAAVVGCLFFPEASSKPVGDQRRLVRDLATELGVPCGRLRGAPVPTGSDVLLRSDSGTYFIGDAAGLVKPALGAGIHLALKSALALANAMAGGKPYEEAMEPTVTRLREEAGDVASTALRLGFATLARDGREMSAQL